MSDGTAILRNDEVLIDDLITKYLSYLSVDDLLAVSTVKEIEELTQ
jgi:hypothetical protein